MTFPVSAFFAVVGRSPEGLLGERGRALVEKRPDLKAAWELAGARVECSSMRFGVDNGGADTARTRFGGVTLCKRVDDITPELTRALCDRRVVRVLLAIKGQGARRDVATVSYMHLRGQIVDQRLHLPNTLDPTRLDSLPVEEITIVPSALEVLSGDRQVRHLHPDAGARASLLGADSTLEALFLQEDRPPAARVVVGRSAQRGGPRSAPAVSHRPIGEFAHLTLSSNGLPIDGGCTLTTLGRAGSIECFEFESRLTRYAEDESCATFGERVFHPLRFRKRIDRATPLLYQALAGFHELRGAVRFFRSNPEGDGLLEHFFTLEFEMARAQSQELVSDDHRAPEHATAPPFEEVTLTAERLVWTFARGNVTCDESTPIYRASRGRQ